MTDNRWTTFKLTASFDTGVRNIYEAWATPAGLESWFLRRAEFCAIAGRQRAPHEFISKEDTYTWYWHGYDDNTVEYGQVLENNGADLIKFTFSGKSIVTVDIQNKYGQTLIELTQENIPQEEDPTRNLYVQCQIGWTFYLANLKSIVEGGKDLRNKRVDLFTSFK
ncbi:MAG: SRPBCC domain-containing protein [Mucilaginibacter sp.]|uniref:SRPBCC family protein n=1 Tax=Mucilaginibacter sp. TaxID=1882438 RepID=UPI0031ACD651